MAGLLRRGAQSLFSRVTHLTRRIITGRPSSITPEADRAWTEEQLRVYATLMPYTSPLSVDTGGFGDGETWEMRNAYREMALREPAVKSAILTKCLAVAQLDPVVRPANRKRPEDRTAARWVDYAIESAYGSWGGLIMNILTPAVVDGWSVVEPVWDHEDDLHPDYPSFWRPTAYKGKDTKFIRLKLDRFRNVMAVQSMTGAQGGLPLDPRDFLIFSHLSFFNNPFGCSDLRAAFRAASLIEAAIRLRSILLENYSGPYLKATANTPEARMRAASMLSKARARGWIVLPEDCDVEVLNLATSNADQFQQTIKDLREEIVTAVQGAYLQLLEGGVANGRGNTQVHQTVAQLFQWWLASSVANLINHNLIPDLVYSNYPRTVGKPLVSFGGIDPAAVTAALQRFATLQQLGLDLSKGQVYDEGYAEEPENEQDRLKPPSAAGAMVPGGGPPPDPGAGGSDPFAFSDGAELVPMASVNTDPDRFQFRAGHAEDGTVRDLPATRFDPRQCKPALTWKDPGGNRWLVDGHHRKAHAERDGAEWFPVQDIAADSAEEAREIGRKANTFAEKEGAAHVGGTFPGRQLIRLVDQEVLGQFAG